MQNAVQSSVPEIEIALRFNQNALLDYYRSHINMGRNEQAWLQFHSALHPIPPDCRISVGRSINSDLRLFDDTAISRDHCTIGWDNNRLLLIDLASRNGTKLNGHRVSSPEELRHHDVITVGESELKILFKLGPGDRQTDSDVPMGM